MFIVLGQLYGETKEKFDEMASALKGNGYQLAYRSETNAEILKEVADEQEDSTT